VSVVKAKALNPEVLTLAQISALTSGTFDK